jgi:hypothetical protein
VKLLLLRPFVRYSMGRDAFVLRLVGKRVGPVWVPRRRVEASNVRIEEEPERC